MISFLEHRINALLRRRYRRDDRAVALNDIGRQHDYVMGEIFRRRARLKFLSRGDVNRAGEWPLMTRSLTVRTRESAAVRAFPREVYGA